MKWLRIMLVCLTALCFSTAALAGMACCNAQKEASQSEMPCHGMGEAPDTGDPDLMDMGDTAESFCQCVCALKVVSLPEMVKHGKTASLEPVGQQPPSISAPSFHIENPPRIYS